MSLLTELSSDQIDAAREAILICQRINELKDRMRTEWGVVPDFFSNDIRYGTQLPMVKVGRMILAAHGFGLHLAVRITNNKEEELILSAEDFLTQTEKA